MIDRRLPIALLSIVSLSSACSASTQIVPNAAPSELTLRYDRGLEVLSGQSPLAESPRWDGLVAHVECVALAKKHALDAESAGATAGVTSWLGFSFGALSFGGIAGAVADRDNALAWLGAGVGSAVVGFIFASITGAERTRADGNAVDAVNFYNDEVGVRGSSCENISRTP